MGSANSSEHGQFGAMTPSRPWPVPGMNYPVERAQRHSFPTGPVPAGPRHGPGRQVQSNWRRQGAVSEGSAQQASVPDVCYRLVVMLTELAPGLQPRPSQPPSPDFARLDLGPGPSNSPGPGSPPSGARLGGPGSVRGGARRASVASGGRGGTGSTYGILRRDHIPPSNTIDVAKLENGEEVRCGCMLKNVPNRVSADELMNFIDRHCLDDDGNRAYDAFYLRIDFKNNVSSFDGCALPVVPGGEAELTDSGFAVQRGLCFLEFALVPVVLSIT